jgi:hypothetical protein
MLCTSDNEVGRSDDVHIQPSFVNFIKYSNTWQQENPYKEMLHLWSAAEKVFFATKSNGLNLFNVIIIGWAPERSS